MGKHPIPLLAAAMLTLAVAGCGSTQHTSSPAATRTATAVGNHQRAISEAKALVARAELPGNAKPYSAAPPRALTGPALGTSSSDHLVDESRLLTVPWPESRTFGWVEAHRPAGLTSAGSGTMTGPGGIQSQGIGWSAPDATAYQNAELEVGVAPDGANRSIVRLDGVDIWISSTPAPDTSTGMRIRVTTKSGCPASVDATDVANSGADLSRRILPPGAPTGGLICAYLPGTGLTARPTHLTHSQADQLARAINRVELGSSGGGDASCPSDTGGTVILAFAYPGGPDIDLWYASSGCQSLDNGRIMVQQIGSTTFGQFQTAFDAVTGQRT